MPLECCWGVVMLGGGDKWIRGMPLQLCGEVRYSCEVYVDIRVGSDVH